MRWLGQVFPVLLIVLGILWTALSMAENAPGWAIAAAIAFGSVLVGSRSRLDR